MLLAELRGQLHACVRQGHSHVLPDSIHAKATIDTAGVSCKNRVHATKYKKVSACAYPAMKQPISQSNKYHSEQATSFARCGWIKSSLSLKRCEHPSTCSTSAPDRCWRFQAVTTNLLRYRGTVSWRFAKCQKSGFPCPLDLGHGNSYSTPRLRVSLDSHGLALFCLVVSNCLTGPQIKWTHVGAGNGAPLPSFPGVRRHYQYRVPPHGFLYLRNDTEIAAFLQS